MDCHSTPKSSSAPDLQDAPGRAPPLDGMRPDAETPNGAHGLRGRGAFCAWPPAGAAVPCQNASALHGAGGRKGNLKCVSKGIRHAQNGTAAWRE